MFWSCIGQVQWPPPKKAAIYAHLTLFEATTMEPLPGMTVDACSADDPDCAAPQATDVSNDEGQVFLEDLPTGAVGWLGSFRVSGPGVATNLVTHVKPLTDDTTYDAPIVSQATLDGAAQLMGTSADPERGHVLVDAHDCTFQLARDVSIAVGSADDGTVFGYGNPPDSNASATDQSGIAVALNVPPGDVTVTGIVTTSAKTFATVQVPIRPGAVTSFGLEPMP
jgi:hypothetical protein